MVPLLLLQALIRSLIQGWRIRRTGAAFTAQASGQPQAASMAAGATSFASDPAALRVDLEPIVDEASNMAQLITIQVGGRCEKCGSYVMIV